MMHSDNRISPEILTEAMDRLIASGRGDDLIRRFSRPPGTQSLHPYQHDFLRRARVVWAGRHPTIRATTESTMTDRRETDSTFTTLLGGTLHVAVKRYSDDTGRVDVHTDRETNYARFPVSGAEAMRMIRSIRSGEGDRPSPRFVVDDPAAESTEEDRERLHAWFSASPFGRYVPGVHAGVRGMYPGVFPRIGRHGVETVHVDDQGREESSWSENDGHCPVPEGTLVDVQWRNGGVFYKEQAGRIGSRACDWSLSRGRLADIVAWRLSTATEEQDTRVGVHSSGPELRASRTPGSRIDISIREPADLLEPGLNLMAGTLILTENIVRHDGTGAALRAYHGGSKAVDDPGPATRQYERLVTQRLEEMEQCGNAETDHGP